MRRLLTVFLGGAFLLCCMAARAQQDPRGLAKSGTARVPDRFLPSAPGAVQMGSGFLGQRYAANFVRLRQVDETDLLDTFERRSAPHQDWQGEHAGKFLHAATLAWAESGDPNLRAKIGRVAKRLIKTQEADGYLGAYAPDIRWTRWDVWVHKYNILGLLTYYQYTHDTAALTAARRAGDLLLRTFGSGRRDLNKAGEHAGMAATSVLEPIVLLYRATGDARYLAFAKWIVKNYDAPGGPAILTSLEKYRTVNRVGNGKAYEMLSNLNGLIELYRVTGEKRLLNDARLAWSDIEAKRRYITGSASAGEFFRDDYVLPNGESANIAETCVTVTWLQMNLHLLRLTGDPRFADEIERTAYNHLAAAQKPTGDQWCYYTPLEGRKPYGNATSCCLSSGPRGIALLPLISAMKTDDGGLALNLYNNEKVSANLPAGRVRFAVQTRYPVDGDIRIVVTPAVTPARGAVRFPLRVRIPAWADGATATVNGKAIPARPGTYAVVTRQWHAGDTVRLNLPMRARLIRGDHGNDGKAAVVRGPLVLALDQELNPSADHLWQVALASDTSLPLRLAGAAKGRLVFTTPGRIGPDQVATPLQLTPFANAGQEGGSRYAVWIARPGRADTRGGSGSLFFGGKVSVSRRGNQEGDIADDDFSTFRVTWDTTRLPEDWFAVTRPTPVAISRVVYAHGRVFHDGGWFDATKGKPRIEVQKQPGGPWETVATLDTYPDTTAIDAKDLSDGKTYSVTFPPVEAVAIRVIGTPACGDVATQAFSSCAELQAFGPTEAKP